MLHRLLLLVALLAVTGCEREVKRAPRAPASAPPTASAPPAAAPSCADWQVTESSASASLAVWCRQFGPCPSAPVEATTPGRLHALPSVTSEGALLVISVGFIGGRSFVFESNQLVGAKIWNDVAYGDCAARGVIEYRGGVLPKPGPNARSCGFVPGRDLLQGPPCRCDRPTLPTLADGNRGPTLRTSLECLYEFDVAGNVCKPTLQEQRELVALYKGEAERFAAMAREAREARGSGAATRMEREYVTRSKFVSHERKTPCQETRITWPYRDVPAQCAYAPDGVLVGLKWGKRYVTDTFDRSCPD